MRPAVTNSNAKRPEQNKNVSRGAGQVFTGEDYSKLESSDHILQR